MKLVKNALISLYINLFVIILLLVSLLKFGLIKNDIGNLIKYLLIAGVIISCIFNAIFALKNVLKAYQLYKNKECNSLRKHMKALKFGVIPYFVLNFVIYLFLFAILFVGSRGIMIVTPIPLIFLFPIFFTYLIVVFTSSYGICFAVINSKEKGLSKMKLVLYTLLQLCFVLDVISTVILLIKYKKVEEIN